MEKRPLSIEDTTFYVPFLYVKNLLKAEAPIRRELKLIEKLNNKVSETFPVEYKSTTYTSQIPIERNISPEEQTALILTLHKIKNSKKSHLTPSKEEIEKGVAGFDKDKEFAVKYKRLMDNINRDIEEYVKSLSDEQKETLIRAHLDRKKEVITV